MKVGVVQFPGTNCELDVLEAVRLVGGAAEIVWHADRRLAADLDAIVLPGGFAHGDYLRTGAIARFSPIMASITEFTRAGGRVLGICNGFQILCEAGLLPGALQKNSGLKFLCGRTTVRVESTGTAVTSRSEIGDELVLPINHFEGCYTCDPATLATLRGENRVVFRYLDNPNGSIDDIAGVCSPEGNVIGLMPHPERACLELLGSADGRVLFEALLAATPATSSGSARPA